MKDSGALKSISYLVSARMVKFIIGLIKSKLSALWLGTEGVGIIAQFNFTSQRIADFTLLSMNHGLVKQIAERKENENFHSEFIDILKTYTFIVIIIAFFSSALLYLFSKPLTIYFFGDSKYYYFFLITTITVPVLILNSLSFGVLKAFRTFKIISRNDITAIILSLLLFVPLAYFYRINGAVIALVVGIFIAFILNGYHSRVKILKMYQITYSQIIKGHFRRNYFNELLLFAGVGLLLGLYSIFADVTVRSLLIKQSGVERFGIYSPVVAWASIFTGFLLPSIYTYLAPRFAETKSDEEINGIINYFLRISTFILIPFVLFGISLRSFLIPFFYSKEFIEAANYLPGHFIGIVFLVWMGIFSQVLTPKGYIKVNAIIMFFLYSIKLVCAYYFIPALDLYGYMLINIIPNIAIFFVYLFVLRSIFNLRISKNNILLMFYAIIVFLVTYSLGHFGFFYSMLFTAIVFIGAFFFMNLEEKNYLISKYESLKTKIDK